MGSIYHYLSSPPLHTNLCNTQQLHNISQTQQGFGRSSSREKASHGRAAVSFTRPRALTNFSLLIAINPPSSSRDLSVILPVSGLLLFVYWLANFVIPDLIVKDFRLDKSNNEDTTMETNLSKYYQKKEPQTSSSSPPSVSTKENNVEKKSPKL